MEKEPIPDGNVRQVKDPSRTREQWNNKIDFLLACVGFSVGLGNVWRFPYLCYKNGGGAFLIPYLICVVIGGIPLFFLEVAVGQFMTESGVNAWRIAPIFKGIGWSTTIIVFFLNCYYNVILSWAFHYMFASLTDKLPWDSCDNWWNTENCRLFNGELINGTNQTESIYKTVVVNGTNKTVRLLDATTEYWENRVLGISNGLEEMGSIKWDLALTLVVAWCVVFLCIWKGIRTSGKVMYVTATSPYIFMAILLIRGCTLPGSLEGILYYIVPDFEKIKDIQVWVDAGTQIFFSYSIGIAALTALGSYNNYNHNSYRDSILFACTNSGTSIFAGFVIFSVLGYMAHQQGTTVDKVAESGPGLAFIAYPKAVAQMPVAPLWSVLFFIMVILLGLDSQFVGVEGFVAAFTDSFPSLKEKRRKEWFTLASVIVMCIVGLSMTTNGGMYVFQLFDYYSGSRIILLVGMFQCIAVAWCYGINRFYDNLEMMFGFRINPYMKVSWVFGAPLFCLVIFVMSAVNYSELDYARPTGVYTYPWWGVAIGWSMAAFAAMWIPIYMIYMIIKYRNNLHKLIEPEDLKPHQLRPQDMPPAPFTDLGNMTNNPLPYVNPAYSHEKI